VGTTAKRAVVWVAAVVLIGCGGNSSIPQTRTLYQYTCCQQADVEKSWQAGKPLTLHWMTQPAIGTPVPSSRYVELSAWLDGPYVDVSSLKRAGDRISALRAPVISADTWQPSELVSSIPLAADTPPGLYDMHFKVTFAGGSMGGASVIKVTTSKA
jgi:hypothetical protein